MSSRRTKYGSLLTRQWRIIVRVLLAIEAALGEDGKGDWFLFCLFELNQCFRRAMFLRLFRIAILVMRIPIWTGLLLVAEGDASTVKQMFADTAMTCDVCFILNID